MTTLTIKLGNWLYHSTNAFEAKLYGLHQERINLHGCEQVYWTNNNTHKPALLLIHGFSASYSVWLRFARFFNDDYHIIIPDLAGHGETGFSPTQNYSIDAQSERLCFLLEALGIESAHIAGNSMGGFIAANMARFHEQHCLSIIVIDPAGVVSPQPSPMLKLLAQGDNPFLIDNDNDFDRFYKMVMAKPPFMPKVVLRGISSQYQSRKEELAKIFADYNKPKDYLDNELAKITVSAVVIWGAKDQLIDVSSADVWQEQLKCESIIWEDLGHMPMIEAPKRCANAVKRFLHGLD